MRPNNHNRFEGIKRDYSEKEVEKLQGTFNIEYTLSKLLSRKLWDLLNTESYVSALGSLSGNQAVQHAKAGLKAIYLSGWQVAADANSAGEMYPDQSLYPYDSAPKLVEAMNNALIRADQIQHMEITEGKINEKNKLDFHMPIIADGEAGFGGPLNVFELTKKFIKAGAAGVHFEDQLASEKKCGHMGGKVLIPTKQHIRNLNSARLAADVCGVPTLIVARTDAESAKLITSDADERDHEFINTDDRTPEGFYRIKEGTGLQHCIKRGIAYAPHADLLWMETTIPSLEVAKEFSEAVKKEFPDQMLAYNCSPSFNWEANIDKDTIAVFREELGKMGFKYQFVTLAGFHQLNHGMFELASEFRDRGMAAYSELQQSEFASEKSGYSATRHQREVGTGYFDLVSEAAAGGESSTTALDDSTEADQFKAAE